MTGRDLFSVGLRLLGVWFLFDAAESGEWAVLRKIGVVRDAPYPPPVGDKLAEHELWALFFLFLALILLCYGDRIASAFYGPAKPTELPAAMQDPSTLE